MTKNRHGLFKSMPIGRCRATLFHIDVFDFVFVAVFQVFTAHTPDESIVAGSGSSVDGPFGRSDGLFVVQPYQTFFLRFAHQVTDSVAGFQVEVVVSFHAASVRVGRHGIPYRAGEPVP